ncbi:hypothetical protein FHY33_003788 [Xanthomonas arboricola]|nr:hypothetical protein [Xanthomonas campestris]
MCTRASDAARRSAPHTTTPPKVASLFCCHYASFNAAHVLADYLAAPLSGTNLISWLLVAAVPKLKRP